MNLIVFDLGNQTQSNVSDLLRNCANSDMDYTVSLSSALAMIIFTGSGFWKFGPYYASAGSFPWSFAESLTLWCSSL